MTTNPTLQLTPATSSSPQESRYLPRSQNTYFRANWISRGFTEALVIAPESSGSGWIVCYRAVGATQNPTPSFASSSPFRLDRTLTSTQRPNADPFAVFVNVIGRFGQKDCRNLTLMCRILTSDYLVRIAITERAVAKSPSAAPPSKSTGEVLGWSLRGYRPLSSFWNLRCGNKS